MYVRFNERIADSEAGIIKVYESINKAKRAMRGAVNARVAPDAKSFINMRRQGASEKLDHWPHVEVKS